MDSYYNKEKENPWDQTVNDSKAASRSPSETFSDICSRNFVDKVADILNESDLSENSIEGTTPLDLTRQLQNLLNDDDDSITETASFEYFAESQSTIYPFDDSTESKDINKSDDSLNLNDTIEEMRRALQSGLNYTMSEPKEKKQHPEIKSLRNKYDDVKSPVGLYIKNSTAVLQKQVNNLATCIPKDVLLPVDDNVRYRNAYRGTLPSVMYKPPKNIFLSEDVGPKLPKSIQKYVPMNVKVIKHEGRIVSGTEENVEEKLLRADLTLDDDQLDYTQDYSILASNVAFIR